MNNVIEMTHPLIKHKISILRDKNTGTNEFRKLIEEIGILMGYEALRDLPLEDVEIETPIETCKTPMISGKKLAIVPILRAGIDMVHFCFATDQGNKNSFWHRSHACYKNIAGIPCNA